MCLVRVLLLECICLPIHNIPYCCWLSQQHPLEIEDLEVLDYAIIGDLVDSTPEVEGIRFFEGAAMKEGLDGLLGDGRAGWVRFEKHGVGERKEQLEKSMEIWVAVSAIG